MLHARRVKKTLFGQIGNATIATRFLIRRAGNLDRAPEIREFGNESLGRNDAGRQPALHVTGAAPVNPVTFQRAAERVPRPTLSHLNDIGMRVEMHALAARRSLSTRHDIPTRKGIAVARCTLGPHPLRFKTGTAQPLIQEIANRVIILTRRIDRRNRNQGLRQSDQVITPVRNARGQPF